jgi:hypothetical protein
MFGAVTARDEVGEGHDTADAGRLTLTTDSTRIISRSSMGDQLSGTLPHSQLHMGLTERRLVGNTNRQDPVDDDDRRPLARALLHPCVTHSSTPTSPISTRGTIPHHVSIARSRNNVLRSVTQA